LEGKNFINHYVCNFVNLLFLRNVVGVFMLCCLLQPLIISKRKLINYKESMLFIWVKQSNIATAKPALSRLISMCNIRISTCQAISHISHSLFLKSVVLFLYHLCFDHLVYLLHFK
jgi:hypothetical protein